MFSMYIVYVYMVGVFLRLPAAASAHLERTNIYLFPRYLSAASRVVVCMCAVQSAAFQLIVFI